MYLSTEKKQEIFKKFGGDTKNTGSTEAQVALFTHRINHLTEHLKKNRKDYGTQKALLDLVGKRKSLLTYYKNKDIVKFRELIKELGIRK
jgi:small subunit ribosomal protein S15